MRVLLDTQIFLWFLAGARAIPARMREVIGDPGNTVLVSAAAVWEIAVKASIGRLQMSSRDMARLPGLIEASGFEELPIRARHAAEVHGLPWHHRDPFDRLMIAQARMESLTFATVDTTIRRYEVALL